MFSTGAAGTVLNVGSNSLTSIGGNEGFIAKIFTAPLLITLNAGVGRSFCNGTPVTIGVNTTGGIAPGVNGDTATYSYAWTPAALVTNPSSLNNTDTIHISILPSPAIPTIIVDGPTTFCSGGSVTLTSSTANSYLWINGATTQSITVNSSGNYSLQVTDMNNCQSATSAATVVTVNSLPVIPVITLSGNTLISSSAVAYQWYFNGFAIPLATRQSYTYATGGDYTVTITNAAACSISSSPYTAIRMIGSTLRNGQIFYYQMYPNPTHQNATVDYNLLSAAEMSIFIIDNSGHHLLTQVNQQQTAGRYQFTLNRNSSALQKGLIFLYSLLTGRNWFNRSISCSYLLKYGHNGFCL